MLSICFEVRPVNPEVKPGQSTRKKGKAEL